MQIYIVVIFLVLLVILYGIYESSTPNSYLFFYGGIPHVIEGNENFEASNKSITLYYANWCGYCKQFMPIWDEFNKKNNQRLTIRKFDCANPDFQNVCNNTNVQGYPTIILRSGNRDIPYDGERTIEALEKFVNMN